MDRQSVNQDTKTRIAECFKALVVEKVLAPGENRHFEPGENSQLWPDRNRQYVPGGCSQPRFGCRF